MNWSLLLLIAIAAQINVAIGERRQGNMRLPTGSRRSLFRPINIQKYDAEEQGEQEASISTFYKSLPASPILKLRGGGAIAKFSKYIGDSRARSWVVLVISIILDSMSSTMMKLGRDEGSIVKLATAYFGFFTSLTGFALCLGAIEVSIAYAVWAALGTAIVSVVGITFFGENYDIYKLLGLGMIIVGVAVVESRS
ncbi:unnamed protein product [Cylindrotheca closterium]|uniref:EamA domain-containing protein n=1 Tax=Cylindrotheca closterium TaxID=2856 RepID=A0AAD2CF59_9STRA|nr:unnamed protein product [Cylindrotheca closterium]